MARRQKYKFAKKEFAKQGKISVGIGCASLFLFLISIFVSLAFRGEAAMYLGGLGLMSMLLSAYGLFLGIRGFSEKKCSQRFSIIGIVINSLILLVFVLLISLGAA